MHAGALPTLHVVVPPWSRRNRFGGSESAVLACRDAWREGDSVTLVGTPNAADAARHCGLRIDRVVTPPLRLPSLAARRIELEARDRARVRWWTHSVRTRLENPVGHTHTRAELADLREVLRSQLGVSPHERCLLPIADHPRHFDARAVTFLSSVLAVQSKSEVVILPRGFGSLNAPRRYAHATDGIMRIIEVPAPVSGWICAVDGLVSIGGRPTPELEDEAARFGVPIAVVDDGPRMAREQLRPILDATGGFRLA